MIRSFRNDENQIFTGQSLTKRSSELAGMPRTLCPAICYRIGKIDILACSKPCYVYNRNSRTPLDIQPHTSISTDKYDETYRNQEQFKTLDNLVDTYNCSPRCLKFTTTFVTIRQSQRSTFLQQGNTTWILRHF